MSRYVGVDLHRRRSQVVVIDGDGEVVSSVNVDNRDPGTLVEAVAVGGQGCGVVIEAAWGAKLGTNRFRRIKVAHIGPTRSDKWTKAESMVGSG